jgi:ATP-dependent DNA helicase 2 subunit 2
LDLGKVKIDRVYLSGDGEEVSEEKKVKSYKYGKNDVPFNEMDEDMLKLKNIEKCFKLLCFTDAKNIPRSQFMSTSNQVIAEPYKDEAEVAISSLVKSLAELEMVAIVKYCRTASASPKLYVLSPVVKSDNFYFIMNQIPFSEDIRQYQFKSFKDIKHSNEQLEATEKLINDFDLMNQEVDEDDEKIESLKTSNTYHIGMLYFFDCLHSKVLDPTSELPELDKNLIKNCLPDMSDDSFYSKMIKKSEDAIKNYQKLFPIKIVEEKSSKKRKYWFSSEKNEIVSLEALQNTGNQTENDAEVMERINEKISIDILSSKPKSVGTINPIGDFNDMINRKDVDLVDQAIEQMKKIILNFIGQSIGDQFFEKAIDALVCLRKGCIQEEESESFNEFIKVLKVSYSKGKKKEMWDRIVKNKISLICDEESNDSDIKKEESIQFLVVDEKIEKSIIKNVEKEEDLFDDID